MSVGGSAETRDQPGPLADHQCLVADRPIGPEPLVRGAPVGNGVASPAFVPRERQVDPARRHHADVGGGKEARRRRSLIQVAMEHVDLPGVEQDNLTIVST